MVPTLPRWAERLDALRPPQRPRGVCIHAGAWHSQDNNGILPTRSSNISTYRPSSGLDIKFLHEKTTAPSRKQRFLSQTQVTQTPTSAPPHPLSQLPTQPQHIPHCLLFRADHGDPVDQRRAHHHAVDQADDAGVIFRASEVKADAQRRSIGA